MRGWDEEEVFNSGDAFFASVIHALNHAQLSIDLESFIFDPDRLGERITHALQAAAERGVRVRLMVDGIGSSAYDPRDFVPDLHPGFAFKVFRPLNPVFQGFSRWLKGLNRRNHRKVCIVDGAQAWLGSMNVTEKHLREFSGDAAWRDTGVRVTGHEIRWLIDAFERAWTKSMRMTPKPGSLTGRILMHRHSGIPGLEVPVRINESLRLRRRNSKDIRHRVILSMKRVWVTNAYFVPDLFFLRSLCAAAWSGVDVRLIVPGKSDLFFMRWASGMFYYFLLREGVQIYEYRPSILHAKTLLIDDWALVGSSNLNQRSLIHDLEVDAVLSSAPSRHTLEEQFLQDLQHSDEIDFETMENKPWYQQWLGKLILLISHWI